MIPMLALIVVTIVSIVLWLADVLLGSAGLPRPNVNPLSVLVMQGGTYLVALVVITLKTDDHLSRPDVARGDAPAWMAIGAQLFGDANSGWLSLPATIVIAGTAITAPAIVDEREWLMFWGWTAFLALSLALAGSTFRQGWQINGVPSWEMPKEPEEEVPAETEAAKPVVAKPDALDAVAEKIGLELDPTDSAVPPQSTEPAASDTGTLVPPPVATPTPSAAPTKPAPTPAPAPPPTMMERLLRRFRRDRTARTTSSAAKAGVKPAGGSQTAPAPATHSLVQRVLVRLGLRRTPKTTASVAATSGAKPAPSAASDPSAAGDSSASTDDLTPTGTGTLVDADPSIGDADATGAGADSSGDTTDADGAGDTIVTDPLGAWSEISATSTAPTGTDVTDAELWTPADGDTAPSDADAEPAIGDDDAPVFGEDEGSDTAAFEDIPSVDVELDSTAPEDSALPETTASDGVDAGAADDIVAETRFDGPVDGGLESATADGGGQEDSAVTDALSTEPALPAASEIDVAELKRLPFASAVDDPANVWGNMPLDAPPTEAALGTDAIDSTASGDLDSDVVAEDDGEARDSDAARDNPPDEPATDRLAVAPDAVADLVAPGSDAEASEPESRLNEPSELANEDGAAETSATTAVDAVDTRPLFEVIPALSPSETTDAGVSNAPAPPTAMEDSETEDSPPSNPVL